MLIAIRLLLASEADLLLPPSVGRAAHAALLARIHEHDAALARYLHDREGPKPLTCSSLMGASAHPDGLRVRAGAPLSLRYTALLPEVAAALQALLIDEPPDAIRLDVHTLQVTGALCDEKADPWTGTTTYEALAAAQASGSAPADRTIRLHFASPTAFRSGGLTVPVPLPSLVFGSLVERWNAFSPIRLSGEVRRFGEEMIAISRYSLHSRIMSHKNEALRIGGVGEASYRALSGDRYWVGVMNVLARFARFSGVGVQTTTGMGQARWLAAGERPDRQSGGRA
jgi:CRISPR-associated endoribonuclease Cas6